MSGYNGRRGPNVSQYIANLNTVPTSEDLLDSPPDYSADLDLFAHTNDFIDWEAGATNVNSVSNVQSFDNNSSSLDLNFNQPTQSTTSASASEPKMDFNLPSNFDFADFTSFQNPIVEQPMHNLSHSQTNSYAVPPTFTSPLNSAVSPVATGFDQASGKKRKLDGSDILGEQSLDESARHAAEEDKRRRNTAASARFRIKKKQREQALEKTAKEMSERVVALETRINQLETENTWLKGLITEKNGGKVSSPDVSAMLKKHIEENAGERINGSRTDGVGTKDEETKA